MHQTADRAKIETLLVANRGEIASRVFRTARAMGIRCVAVFVDADADAPFVKDADLAVRLPGTYLDAEAIIEAAHSAGADAVHPGYGFLSENASFAEAVVAADLIWIGPTSAVISAMGDKLEAKKHADNSDVPTLPSTDDLGADQTVGYPLLVKAAAGGGGKGMRVVESADELAASLAAAQREALNGFGDDTVFLERYVGSARHVEIQIMGDHHGKVVHYGERECSIQRRHQKIIEESPSPAVDTALRTIMGEAAVRLGKALGYQSAGTVEFLLDESTGEFFFLEVNTRLQVEHPVTEEVTGLDLVAEQLLIAMGAEVSDVSIDAPGGHAIEVRLYAEDPSVDFLPATGTLTAFTPEESPAVRWESSVETGSEVSVSFDPMLAKVISHATSRSQAAGSLARALEQLHLGGVRTNRDFLVNVLRSDAFLAGDTTTDFIDRVDPPRSLNLGQNGLRHASITAALWLQGRNRVSDPVFGALPSGWRNARLPAQSISFRIGDHETSVHYRLGRDGEFQLDDGSVARVHEWSEKTIDVEIDGLRSQARVTNEDQQMWLQVPAGTVAIEIVPRFELPGSDEASGGFLAPMPGVVLDVRVEPGDKVNRGQTLLVLEAMKMEHHVNAPEDGVVAEVLVVTGQQVDNGATMLVMEEPVADGREEA